MDCECDCLGNGQSNAILFNILSRAESTPSEPSYKRVPQTCHCEKRRTVCLKTPSETCPVASDVLVKTVHFMKSLPAFQQLPPKDPAVSAAELLGAALHSGSGTGPGSLRGAWLSGAQHAEENPAQRPRDAELWSRAAHAGRRADAQACLKKFWSLDLSPKEFAYLKGTVIFNPGTLSKTNMVLHINICRH